MVVDDFENSRGTEHRGALDIPDYILGGIPVFAAEYYETQSGRIFGIVSEAQ